MKRHAEWLKEKLGAAKPLVEVGKTDPKRFWNIFDKMSKWGKGGFPSDKIPTISWKKIFRRPSE